jgi:hypothetical protein
MFHEVTENLSNYHWLKECLRLKGPTFSHVSPDIPCTQIVLSQFLFNTMQTADKLHINSFLKTHLHKELGLYNTFNSKYVTVPKVLLLFCFL